MTLAEGERSIEEPQSIEIVPLSLSRDLALVHEWLRHPKAWAWGMSNLSLQGLREYFAQVQRDPRQSAWLGYVEGAPLFLFETYDPTKLTLDKLTEVRPGDCGMHLLVAPTGGRAVTGFTTRVMNAVLEFCFGRLHAERIVVEPDWRNLAIAAKNAEAGFQVIREVRLGDKLSHLSVLDRAAYVELQSRGDWSLGLSSHLQTAPMLVAHRRLVTKGLAEFAHERLITPQQVAGDPKHFRVQCADVEYLFRADLLELEHWAIDPTSVARIAGKQETDLDAQQLILDLRSILGIPDALLSTYLEEIASTVASFSYRLTHTLRSDELAEADFQTIESSMTDGHPNFLANSGRIGFGLTEYHLFSPEAGRCVRFEWIAVRRSLSTLSLSEGWDESAFDSYQLSHAERRRMRACIRAAGADPDAYFLLPLHPWQWEHRISITFAPDLGRGDLIYLGVGGDEYKAQQSIRTFANTSDARRPYVKTALAVQNMGFLRGLSPAYMRVTPAINDWVSNLVESDQYLQGIKFSILREFATLGYTGDAYHRTGLPSAQTKMLAALWRESAVSRLGESERLITMAALLHRDMSGVPLISALIRSSDVSAKEWVAAYLRAYLLPLVHCLVRHKLAFMPHGENLILVLGPDGSPSRVIMKDIGEEVAVLSEEVLLPSEVERIRQPLGGEEQSLSIFTDVFDGVLRHISAVLHLDDVLPQDTFWSLVRDAVHGHAANYGALHESIDLFADSFPHSCLNRLQLRNTLQMVNLADQSSSLIYAGRLRNPIG